MDACGLDWWRGSSAAGLIVLLRLTDSDKVFACENLARADWCAVRDRPENISAPKTTLPLELWKLSV